MEVHQDDKATDCSGRLCGGLDVGLGWLHERLRSRPARCRRWRARRGCGGCDWSSGRWWSRCCHRRGNRRSGRCHNGRRNHPAPSALLNVTRNIIPVPGPIWTAGTVLLRGAPCRYRGCEPLQALSTSRFVGTCPFPPRFSKYQHLQGGEDDSCCWTFSASATNIALCHGACYVTTQSSTRTSSMPRKTSSAMRPCP